jgi:hypothetical protein
MVIAKQSFPDRSKTKVHYDHQVVPPVEEESHPTVPSTILGRFCNAQQQRLQRPQGSIDIQHVKTRGPCLLFDNSFLPQSSINSSAPH